MGSNPTGAASELGQVPLPTFRDMEIHRNKSNSGNPRERVIRITNIFQLNIVCIGAYAPTTSHSDEEKSTFTTPLGHNKILEKQSNCTELRWGTSMQKLKDKQIHKKGQYRCTNRKILLRIIRQRPSRRTTIQT